MNVCIYNLCWIVCEGGRKKGGMGNLRVQSINWYWKFYLLICCGNLSSDPFLLCVELLGKLLLQIENSISFQWSLNLLVLILLLRNLIDMLLKICRPEHSFWQNESHFLYITLTIVCCHNFTLFLLAICVFGICWKMFI